MLSAGHNMLEDYVRSRKLLPVKKKVKTPKTYHDPRKDYKDGEVDIGVMYSQDGIVTGTNGKNYPRIEGHGSRKFDHYLSHCPDEIGQQNLNVEEVTNEKEVEEEVELGVQQMQIEGMMDDASSSSSKGSYLLDFRDCQFLQRNLTSKYVLAAKVFHSSEMKKKLRFFKDTKSLLLDSGSTFSCCNNSKFWWGLEGVRSPLTVYQMEGDGY